MCGMSGRNWRHLERIRIAGEQELIYDITFDQHGFEQRVLKVHLMLAFVSMRPLFSQNGNNFAIFQCLWRWAMI
jgi:hypothetical protein